MFGNGGHMPLSVDTTQLVMNCNCTYLLLLFCCEVDKIIICMYNFDDFNWMSIGDSKGEP